MYTVAEIQVNGKFFYTCRSDDRTPAQVVADGVAGLKSGMTSRIYQELTQAQQCTVLNVFQNLKAAEAKAKQKTLIDYAKSKGFDVLNQRSFG